MSLSRKTIVGFAVFFIVGVLVVSYVVYDRTTSHDSRISANDAPQENTFYAGVHEGEPVLFYRYKGLMIAYQHADAFTGFIVPYTHPYTAAHNHKNYGNFSQIENPKKLFTFDGFARVEHLLLDEDKKVMMLSVVGGPNDSTNFIYQVNLETQESKIVWQQEIKQSDSTGANGIAHIDTFVPDQYIVFALIKGDGPPANPPVNAIVKNLRTGDEKVLGAIGEAKIDLSENVVSYKQYAKVRETCLSNDPVCFATDEYKIVNKPDGQTQTQPLP